MRNTIEQKTYKHLRKTALSYCFYEELKKVAHCLQSVVLLTIRINSRTKNKNN